MLGPKKVDFLIFCAIFGLQNSRKLILAPNILQILYQKVGILPTVQAVLLSNSMQLLGEEYNYYVVVLVMRVFVSAIHSVCGT